jgi:hypothetical protein
MVLSGIVSASASRPLPRLLPYTRRLRLSLVRSPLLAGEPVRCAGLPVVDGSVDLVTGALILLSSPYSVTLILDLLALVFVSPFLSEREMCPWAISKYFGD